MPIKWSPGCKCCEAVCEEYSIGYTPSTPLERGEYTTEDEWAPFTEYLEGDIVTHVDLTTGRMTAWRVPVTLFSGSGWTIYEESRYVKIKEIDRYDRPTEWYPIGGGWQTLTQIQVEDLVLANKIPKSAGYVSVEDVTFNPDWIARYNVQMFTDEVETNPIDINDKVIVYLLGATEVGVDNYPQTGTFIRLVDTDEIFLYPDGCRTDDPPTLHVSGELGVFEDFQTPQDLNSIEALDAYYIGKYTAGVSYSLCRTDQPLRGNVVAPIDLSLGTVDIPLNLSSVVFGTGAMVSGTSPDIRDINKVFVVEKAGYCEFAGEVFYGDIDDYFRVLDIEKVLNVEIDAFEHVLASTVETQSVLMGNYATEAWNIVQTPGGGKVGIFVAEYPDADTDFNPSVKFFGVQGSTTATLQNPDCEVYLTYECPCNPQFFDLQSIGGVNLLDLGKLPSSLFPPIVDRIGGLGAIFEEVSRGADPVGGLPLGVLHIDECKSIVADSVVVRGWAVNRESDVIRNDPLGGGDPEWLFRRRESLQVLVQKDGYYINGILGRQLIYQARSAVGLGGTLYKSSHTFGGYATQEEAENASLFTQQEIDDFIENQVKKANCSGRFSMDDQDPEGLWPIPTDGDTNGDGDIDFTFGYDTLDITEVIEDQIDKEAFSCYGVFIYIPYVGGYYDGETVVLETQ